VSLTAPQLRQFADEGWLFLPDCFSEAEVEILRDEATRICSEDRQEVWREKTGAPRTHSLRTPTTRRSGCSVTIRG
jgi:ectoine hydroxylase